MANVLNRTSMLYLESVNTPDYDPAEWLINPDLSEVEGISSFYWKIVEEAVVPMSEDERVIHDHWLAFKGLDLAGAIALKSRMVNDRRVEVMTGGWVYQGVVYDSDDQARQNMTGTMSLVQSGYTLPNNWTWRAKNNTNVPFDNANFPAFFQASCEWMARLYNASWYHKGQIAKLTTIEDVYAYDFSAGWPTSV